MGKKPKNPSIPAYKGEADINSNLYHKGDTDKGNHVVRVREHQLASNIDKKGHMVTVNSDDYKTYNDTIKSRIANYKPGDNIYRDIPGNAGHFLKPYGNELEKHFKESESMSGNPDYKKTVHYGQDKNHGFEGVYKVEENIPKESVMPKKNAVAPDVKKSSPTTRGMMGLR